MDQRYNLDNLEALFKQYLLAGNNSTLTIKNYLSDLRHFIGWAILKFKVQSSKFKVNQLVPEEFVTLIETPLIEEYKQYLISNNIPQKTINRRLSTLRKFFTFCIHQGWRQDNPAKKINNLVVSSAPKLLSEFKKYLGEKKGLSNYEIEKISQDIDEFLKIISFSQTL